MKYQLLINIMLAIAVISLGFGMCLTQAILLRQNDLNQRQFDLNEAQYSLNQYFIDLLKEIQK